MDIEKELQELIDNHYSGDIDSRDEWLRMIIDLKSRINKAPSHEDIDTASIDYREVSNKENMGECGLIAEVNWWDKQDAFQAGAVWMYNKIRNQNGV